jgi:hypothetical protein
VSQDVGPESVAAVVGEADLFSERGDDGPCGAVGQTSASTVEQQRWRRVGGWPGGAVIQPPGEGGAQLGAGQWELAQLAAIAAFPPYAQCAFAGGEREVIEVETHDLPHAQTGIEGQQRHHGVPRGAAVLDRARR